MQLISLKLIKCRRFKVSLHDVITYVPNAIEQVILGTNGSGKSSLLGQIFNIVPAGEMFYTDGEQEHVCSHKGKLYRSVSKFATKAGHHSFCVSRDGEEWEELNESGLQTDQRMLVKHHLGLDQDLIELASGATRLSQMDAATRRKWLMRICGTDFDYINQLHQVLKKRHRDFKGTIDTLTEAMVDTIKDIEAIAVDVTENSLEFDDLQQLSSNISGQLEKLGSVDATVATLREALGDTAAELKSVSSKIIKTYKGRKEEFRSTPAERIESLRRTVDMEVSGLNGQQKILQARLRDVIMAIDAIGKDNLKEPTLVLNRLDSVNRELDELLSFGVPTVDLITITQQISDTDVGMRRMEPIVADVPHVEDLKALKQRVEKGRKRLDVLNKELMEVNGSIEKFSFRLEHYNCVDEVDCPQCKAKFRPGFDNSLLQKYTHHLGQYNERRTLLQTELDELNQSLTVYDQLVDSNRQMHEVIRQHGSINEVWDGIVERKMLFTFPAMIVAELNGYLKRLQGQQSYLKLKAEQERLLNIKASLEGDTGHLLETAEQLEHELFDLNTQAQSAGYEIREMESDIRLAGDCYTLVDRFNHQYDVYSGLLEQLHKATILQHLQQARVSVNTRIGTLHAMRSKYTGLMDRQEVLREQIDSSKQKYEVYKLLDKATSPTEGVPADILRAFMDHFLDHMNRHSSKVWTYQLELTDVPAKGSLNCQFPLLVAGDPEPVADFKSGSTGQVSMIDFAFKLVVFMFEGLADYPLLVDEFGKDFDDEHREQLIMYIKEMIESKTYSQLFMISHYASVYSAFDNAEVVVLDARNITTPAEYNTSITFG